MINLKGRAQYALRLTHKAVLILCSFIYGGLQYECPCCNRKVHYFMPYGTHKLRINAECPICRAAERDRIEMLYYKKANPIYGRVLHFAPERTQYAYLESLSLAGKIDYLTVDINENAYGVKKKEDICSLSFENESFDCIICNQVLEHINDDEKAISEMGRVLKHDGVAVITVPIDIKNVTLEEEWINTDSLRIKYYGEADHKRMNGIDFEEKLYKNGIKGEKKYSKDFLSKKEMRKYGLKENEFFFICRKREN